MPFLQQMSGWQQGLDENPSSLRSIREAISVNVIETPSAELLLRISETRFSDHRH